MAESPVLKLVFSSNSKPLVYNYFEILLKAKHMPGKLTNGSPKCSSSLSLFQEPLTCCLLYVNISSHNLHLPTTSYLTVLPHTSYLLCPRGNSSIFSLTSSLILFLPLELKDHEKNDLVHIIIALSLALRIVLGTLLALSEF